MWKENKSEREIWLILVNEVERKKFIQSVRAKLYEGSCIKSGRHLALLLIVEI